MTAHPQTHDGDPVTSHEAEERHEASGAMGKNCALVLACLQAVAARGGAAPTGAELGLATRFHPGLNVYETRRRLSDLKNRGLVQQGPPRVCRVSGRRAVTWEAS